MDNIKIGEKIMRKTFLDFLNEEEQSRVLRVTAIPDGYIGEAAVSEILSATENWEVYFDFVIDETFNCLNNAIEVYIKPYDKYDFEKGTIFYNKRGEENELRFVCRRKDLFYFNPLVFENSEDMDGHFDETQEIILTKSELNEWDMRD